MESDRSVTYPRSVAMPNLIPSARKQNPMDHGVVGMRTIHFDVADSQRARIETARSMARSPVATGWRRRKPRHVTGIFSFSQARQATDVIGMLVRDEDGGQMLRILAGLETSRFAGFL